MALRTKKLLFARWIGRHHILAALIFTSLVYTYEFATLPVAHAGSTWTDQTAAGTRQWLSIASSADGTKLAAGVNSGHIFTSTDSGATWTDRASSGSRYWYSIASSADGTKLAAAVHGSGDIYTSADSGVTWTDQTAAGTRQWLSIASSADGSRLAAGVADTSVVGDIYTSADSGVTWTDQTAAGTRFWWNIASSADGTKLVAVVAAGGDIWTGALTFPGSNTNAAASFLMGMTF